MHYNDTSFQAKSTALLELCLPRRRDSSWAASSSMLDLTVSSSTSLLTVAGLQSLVPLFSHLWRKVTVSLFCC